MNEHKNTVIEIKLFNRIKNLHWLLGGMVAGRVGDRLPSCSRYGGTRSHQLLYADSLLPERKSLWYFQGPEQREESVGSTVICESPGPESTAQREKYPHIFRKGYRVFPAAKLK